MIMASTIAAMAVPPITHSSTSQGRLWTLESYLYFWMERPQNSRGHGSAFGASIRGYFAVPGVASGSQGDDALANILVTRPVTVTVAADNRFAT